MVLGSVGRGYCKRNWVFLAKMFVQIVSVPSKSATIEHPIDFHKLYTTRASYKVSQVAYAGKNSTSPLYNEMTKIENFFHEKNPIKEPKQRKNLPLIKINQILKLLKF